MDRKYWEEMSANYDELIHSVFDHDIDGLVKERIASAERSGPDCRAADLGCGVGKFTPSLALAFGGVEACDLSETGVGMARVNCVPFRNVRFHRLDLTRDPMPFDPVDFVLCVNVLIMPSLDQRLRAWRTVTNQIVRGGTLLLVVPSLESVQMETFREVDARIEEGDTCRGAVRKAQSDKATASDLQQGIHLLDGIRTKHYLKVELEALLADHGFEVTELTRILYRDLDDNELTGAWDWLAMGRRR